MVHNDKINDNAGSTVSREGRVIEVGSAEGSSRNPVESEIESSVLGNLPLFFFTYYSHHALWFLTPVLLVIEGAVASRARARRAALLEAVRELVVLLKG